MSELTDNIGDDGIGRLVHLQGNKMWVNDNFVLATLISIITALDMSNPQMGETISAISEKVYAELKKENPESNEPEPF